MPTFQEYVMAESFTNERAVGNDSAIAIALNAQDQPAGWIPPRHILSVLLTTGEIGVLEWIQRFGRIPGQETDCPIELYSLVIRVLRATALSEYNFKTPKADLLAGGGVLVGLTLIQQATVDLIVAGEVMTSRAELSELGRLCTAEDVSLTINRPPQPAAPQE